MIAEDAWRAKALATLVVNKLRGVLKVLCGEGSRFR